MGEEQNQFLLNGLPGGYGSTGGSSRLSFMAQSQQFVDSGWSCSWL
jgi:hypothetical protein